MSQKYPMHCYVQNFGGYGDVISVEGPNVGISMETTYLIIADNMPFIVFSKESLYELTFGVKAKEKVAKLIYDKIPLSKYLVINVNTKKYSFVFDNFCIHELSHNRMEHIIKELKGGNIMQLSHEGQEEINEVLDSDILSDESQESVLFLYKKLCRFADDFTDMYSQLSSLWPKTNIKSAQ